MTRDEALAFVGRHHRAVLATTRSDGRPQLSPVTVVADDEGRLLISTRETAVKTRNVGRDPQVSVCVFTEDFYGPWAQLEGEAEVLSLPAAMELLVDYYRRAAGEHPDWEDYRSAMRSERRVVMRVSVTRTGPTVAG